ncbi:hypothetical protein BDZ89DRAFT_1140045 [Hymenopellis radicata]|nr:hypothetical protein BDZ89DRAFT_1140045 [Hymenopellis radicata]
MAIGRFPTYAVYGLLWMVACVLLGLTAYRVHITEHIGRSYEPIVVELLVSSILAILWVPIAFVLLLSTRIIRLEMAGAFVLWVMWLVGAVDTTNRILPGKNYCPVSGKECNILTTILAFAWIGWSLLTIVLVIGLMNLAAPAEGRRVVREKSEASQS